MLEINDVEGVRCKNIEFDGKGRRTSGVQISGRAPGTAFEGVTVRGVKSAGIKLWNAAGDAGRPDHARPRAGDPLGPRTRRASGSTPRNVGNEVHARFEDSGSRVRARARGSPGRARATIWKSPRNRFFNLDTGAVVRQPPTKASRVKGKRGSEHDLPRDVGLLFDVPPAATAGEKEPPRASSNLVVRRNYFAQTLRTSAQRAKGRTSRA